MMLPYSPSSAPSSAAPSPATSSAAPALSGESSSESSATCSSSSSAPPGAESAKGGHSTCHNVGSQPCNGATKANKNRPGHANRRAKSVWSPEMDPQPPGRNKSVVGLLTATIRCTVCSEWIPIADADDHSENCVDSRVLACTPCTDMDVGTSAATTTLTTEAVDAVASTVTGTVTGTTGATQFSGRRIKEDTSDAW
jgi:hypothetical protein